MPWPGNRILNTLQLLDRSASAQEIATATSLDIDQVWKSCETLVKNKLITRPERGVYRITEAGKAAITHGKGCMPGPKAPTGPVSRRRNTFTQRLWNALRIEQKGTIGGFVSMILQEDEDEQAAMTAAQKYICALCRANYMVRLPGRSRGTAVTSNGYVRYLLVVNSGPKAPMVRRIEKSIFDPNVDQVVPFTEGSHEP